MHARVKPQSHHAPVAVVVAAACRGILTQQAANSANTTCKRYFAIVCSDTMLLLFLCLLHALLFVILPCWTHVVSLCVAVLVVVIESKTQV